MVVKIIFLMKKEFLILIILILSSCGSYRVAETYKQIANKGYAGMKYQFSDSGNRNIEITFKSDSTLTVINRTNIAQNYHLLSFNRAYSYTMLDIASVKIVKMLQSDKNLSQNSYIKPYDTKQYYLDNNAVKLVFPDIIGDTIRFSSDFQELQVREFCLQRVKK